MDERPSIQFNRIFRYILTAATIAIVLALLWYFKWVTIYILVGLIFSLIGRPIYNMLEKVRVGKFKIPNAIKAVVSIISVWATLGGILLLVIPLLIREGNRLSKIDPDMVIKEMEQPLNKSINFLDRYGLISFEDTATVDPSEVFERIVIISLIPDSVDSAGVPVPYKIDTIQKRLTHEKNVEPVSEDSISRTTVARRIQVEDIIRKYVRKAFDFAQIQNLFGSLFGAVANLFALIAASTFIAFFFLKDQNLFANIVLSIVPEKFERQTIIIMHESRKMLSRYFIGLCFELLGVMTLTAIGLLIIGFNIQTAVAIGFFCGFFNIIPYVGPFIGGLLGIVLGLTHNIDHQTTEQLYWLLIKMVGVFWIVQIIDNNILQTLIFARSVKAHPLEIFLVIVIAGYLAGIPGMIFAVPAYTFLRIIAKQFFQNFKFVRSLTRNL